MNEIPPSDPFDDLARELRTGAGREWREEAEQTETETHRYRLRRRTLADLGAELLHRGDSATVVAGDRIASGRVEGAGTDYVTLVSDALEVDVRLDRVVLRADRSPAGGGEQAGGSRTWLARLREFEQTGEPVELWMPATGSSVRGRVEIVASDHLVVVEALEREVYVPLDAVVMVIRQRTPRRQ
ncbi:MAG: hypothetical protein R6X29_08590 [Acidimicrobiia bacterium]